MIVARIASVRRIKKMSQTNLNNKDIFHVRQTEVKVYLNEKEMSPLGRKLMKIAKDIENSDEQVFDEAAVEKELEKRLSWTRPC